MSPPRISIVIPAHDAATALVRTLASLQAQTRTDWEALVVDDGSTGGIRQVVLEQAQGDRRIRLVDAAGPSQPEGVSSARNRGLGAARGCFVLFLGADAWLAPTTLRSLAAAPEANPRADAAYCGHRRLTADGAMGPPVWHAGIADSPFESFARSFETVIHAVMLVRAAVQKLGGFDTSLGSCEDWDLFQRLARAGAQFVAVPVPLVACRISPGWPSRNTHDILADGRIVIERGFAADRRVAKPAGLHEDGTRQARGMSRHMALGLHAMRCAAVEAGHGRDASEFLLALPDRRDWVLDACRGIVLDGLSFGRGCQASDLAHEAPRHARLVRRLCETVAARSNRPTLAAKLEFALTPEILGTAADPQRVVGDVLMVRQDIARLRGVAAPDGVDQVSIEVRADGRVLSRVALPAALASSRAAVIEAVVQAMGVRAYVSANMLHRRPRFWVESAQQAFSALLDVPRPTGVGRSPRHVVRTALQRAAIRQGVLHRAP